MDMPNRPNFKPACSTCHSANAPISNDWIQYRRNPFIRREQDATAKDSPPKPHRGSLPETPDAVVGHDAREGLHGASTFRRLRAGFDRVKGLRGESGCYAGN